MNRREWVAEIALAWWLLRVILLAVAVTLLFANARVGGGVLAILIVGNMWKGGRRGPRRTAQRGERADS